MRRTVNSREDWRRASPEGAPEGKGVLGGLSPPEQNSGGHFGSVFGSVFGSKLQFAPGDSQAFHDWEVPRPSTCQEWGWECEGLVGSRGSAKTDCLERKKSRRV